MTRRDTISHAKKNRENDERNRETCRRYLTEIVGEDIGEELRFHPFMNDVIVADEGIFNTIAQETGVNEISNLKKSGLHFSVGVQDSKNYTRWNVYLDVSKRDEFLTKYGSLYTIE
ncbi:hypothetical protein J4221_04405 [Candidatus Pacearchaeota archaeon]|nr:hypothetical protein [Candidatus Pacearchaeota archaeon]